MDTKGETEKCPFCGNKDIEYKTSSVKLKLPRIAGGRHRIKYFHFYSCKFGANIKGKDQFDALKKWNSRITEEQS